MNLYDFTVANQHGEDVSLATYKQKVVLIVNTATGCGFSPQYDDLQSIYEEFHDDGFEILDFPCNQFAGQAPGSNEEIHSFCKRRFGISFPQFAKIDVIGDEAIPLYKWLSTNTSFHGFQGAMGIMLSSNVKKMDPDFASNGNIKWNFTKFLIDREGNIVQRFEPTESLSNIKKAIADLL